jgi:hypothetical protein
VTGLAYIISMALGVIVPVLVLVFVIGCAADAIWIVFCFLRRVVRRAREVLLLPILLVGSIFGAFK